MMRQPTTDKSEQGKTLQFMDECLTNSSGMATLMWKPRDYLNQYPHMYSYFVITAEINETSELAYSWARIVIDARSPTVLELLSPEVVKISAGVYYRDAIVVRLCAQNGSVIPNKTIYLYNVDVRCSDARTNASGIACWDAPQTEGLYCYKAAFSGTSPGLDPYYKSSNEVKVVIDVATVPVSIFFDVQPREVEPLKNMALSAQVINTTSGSPLEGFTANLYKVRESGSQEFVDAKLTNASGWVDWSFTYYVGEPFTYLVNVTGAKVAIVSPVVVNVANSTFMQLGIGKGAGSSFNYTINGLLWHMFGVQGKPVKIYSNDTLLGTATTYGVFGKFNLSVSLPPVDNKATLYNVKAVFEGDDPRNVTSYLYTPNGTRYEACAFIYHCYAPSVNYAAVTVEPQSIQVAAASNVTVTEDGVKIDPPKTPEDYQKEAGGSLGFWHEFSWWYPWYRLHTTINVNPTIDIGFNPILPGGVTWDWRGLEAFAGVLEEVWQEVMLDFTGVFISYTLAKGLSIWNWVPGIVAEGVKGIVQYYLLWASWNDQAKMLAMSIANFLMGFIALFTSVGEAFVKALQGIITSSAFSVVMLTMNKIIPLATPLQVVRTPVDYIESLFVDFPIAILALLRYLGKL